jgi:hypothetical protein
MVRQVMEAVGVKLMEAYLLGLGAKHVVDIPSLLYKGYGLYDERRRNRKAHKLASDRFGFVEEPNFAQRTFSQKIAAKKAGKAEVYKVLEGPAWDKHVALEFKTVPNVRRKYHFKKNINKIACSRS